MRSSAMTGSAPASADRQGADPWKQRVDSGDWQAIGAELDS